MGDTTTKMTTTKSFIITKKELAVMLNCVSPSGVIYYQKLKKFYFNDEILSQIGITRERYRIVNRGAFSIEESKRIVDYHNLHQYINEVAQ